MILHRLNSEGMARFTEYLDLLAKEPKVDPPMGILDSPETSEPIEPTIEVPAVRLVTRQDAAKLLDTLLAPLPNPERDKGLWAWLSLYYCNSVCPEDPSGSRKAGERYRHVAEVGNFQRYYRHLLLGPYLILRTYANTPEVPRALLCQSVHKPGDVVGQLAAYQELITNPGVIGLATRLYYDEERMRERRGSQNKTRGGARRLVDILNQFDLTWDLYGMNTSEIEAMLPKEFDRFRTAKA